MATESLTGSISASLSSSADLSAEFSRTATGGAVVGGSAGYSKKYTYVSNGYSLQGAGIKVGWLQDPIETTLTYIFGEDFTFDVDAYVDVGVTLRWNVGNAPLRTYRVEGECRYPTALGDGVGGLRGGCDVIPIQTLDTNCVGAQGKVTFVTNIHARDTQDLCRTLKDIKWTWPVSKLQRWSRPYTPGIAPTDDCNYLEDVSFCDIPECLEICLKETGYVDIGATFFIRQSFHFHTGSGGITMSGSASCRVVPQSHIGSGGIVMGGEAGVKSSAWHYVGSGDITMGGEAVAKSSYYSYEGSGGISMGGESLVTSPDWHYEGSGNITMGGSAGVTLRFAYNPTGNTQDTPSVESGIKTGGAADLGKYYVMPDGGIVISGEADYGTTAISYEGSGGISLGGEAGVVSPDWHYIPAGGITMGGSAEANYYGYSYEYEGSGGIVIAGDASYRDSSDGDFWYVASGGISMGGSADCAVTSWRYTPTGGITIGGSAGVNSSWGGEIIFNAGATFSLESIEVSYSEYEEEQGTLAALSNLVNTRCGICDSIPVLLRLNHNLDEMNIFSNFLARNNITFPDVIPLRYSQNSGWTASLHYTDSSNNISENERWSFIVEWNCVNEYGGVDLGEYFWKFSIYIIRKNLTTGVDFDSRILIIYPSTEICTEAELRGLNFTFQVDTENKYVSNDLDVNADNQIIFDNIGLFEGLWLKRPYLKFAISEFLDDKVIQRQDIRPIFPVDPLLIR